MLSFVLFSNGFKVSRWLTTTLSYFPAWEKKTKRSKDVVLQKKHFPPKRASSPATSKTSFISSVFSRHWKCNTPTKLFHFSTKHFLKINQIQMNKKKKKRFPSLEGNGNQKNPKNQRWTLSTVTLLPQLH